MHPSIYLPALALLAFATLAASTALVMGGAA